MSVYYNEYDKFAAACLRELIKAKLIADGEVDERSITEVRAEDLREFNQCHFFAGIGGWSYALRLAGWPDTRSVWTGSCPCQPFSSAGKGAVTADSRHLWPAFFKLIAECRPSVVAGEQVASADGRAWLDLVFTDLEGSAYRVGAANLCAAGVGAPHIRQRLYWVADTENDGHSRESERQRDDQRTWSHGETDRLGLWDAVERNGEVDELADATMPNNEKYKRTGGQTLEPGRDSHISNMGHALNERSQGYRRSEYESVSEGRSRTERHSSAPGFWDNVIWLPCRDGKSRAVESVVEPLADGLSDQLGRVCLASGEDIIAPLIEGGINCVGRLRGYGNAICPEVAAEFIKAYSKCL